MPFDPPCSLYFRAVLKDTFDCLVFKSKRQCYRNKGFGSLCWGLQPGARLQQASSWPGPAQVSALVFRSSSALLWVAGAADRQLP